MIIKESATKAYDVKGVIIKGQKYIGVRQMYATAKDTVYKHGRQGINIPIEMVPRITKAITKWTEEDRASKFETVELKAKE